MGTDPLLGKCQNCNQDFIVHSFVLHFGSLNEAIYENHFHMNTSTSAFYVNMLVSGKESGFRYFRTAERANDTDVSINALKHYCHIVSSDTYHFNYFTANQNDLIEELFVCIFFVL
jgi:hypothetical protein